VIQECDATDHTAFPENRDRGLGFLNHRYVVSLDRLVERNVADFADGLLVCLRQRVKESHGYVHRYKIIIYKDNILKRDNRCTAIPNNR